MIYRLALSDSYLKEVLAACVSSQAKPWRVQQLVRSRAMESSIAEGLADSVPCVVDLMRKIVMGPTIDQYMQGMKRFLFESFDEFTDIMIDMTFKFAMSTTGQLPHGSAGPRTGSEINGVISCKGKSGTLLGNTTSHSESFADQLRCLLSSVPDYARQSVQTIASDAPEKLLSGKDELLQHFPNLKAVVEDVVHVKIRVLKHSNMKRSRASELIHSAATSMFFVPRRAREGEQYRWQASVEEKREGAEGFAEGEQLTKEAAADKLRQAKGSDVDVTAHGWGVLCGAVAVRAGVARKEDSDLRKTLLNPAKRFAFLRNSSLRRSELTPAQLCEAHCGTSNLEAIHREMRTWGVGVWKQDRSLLKTKLRVFLLMKMGCSSLRLWHTSGRPQETVAGMLAQSFRSDPTTLQVLAEIPEEMEAERVRRQAATTREREIQEARVEARAAAQAEMGLVHLVAPRVGKSVHRQAAAQRTFKSRRGGPPLIRSREAERSQKRREGHGPHAAPSAHVPMQHKDHKPRKRKGLRVVAEAPPAASSAQPRKRLRRKTAPVETPEAKRRRLNRERVLRCRLNKPKAKAKPRVKRTTEQMQAAALAGVQARRLRQAAMHADAQVQQAPLAVVQRELPEGEPL